MSELARTLERKEEIITAKPARIIPFRAAADNLSRRVTVRAQAELLNEALGKVTKLCYEIDNGHAWNVDKPTGRILIPVPWGSMGHSSYGLYPREAHILRTALMRHQTPEGDAPLYTYDPDARGWFLNIFDYPRVKPAQAWVKRNGVTAELFSEINAIYQGKRRQYVCR